MKTGLAWHKDLHTIAWLKCALFLVALGSLPGCAMTRPEKVPTCSETGVDALSAEASAARSVPLQIREMLPFLDARTAGSSQLVLVTGTDPRAYQVKVYLLERDNRGWRLAAEPIDAVIGKNGFAEPGRKREGDMKAPTGVFSLERSFGYARSVLTKMPYTQMTDDDVWVDDAEARDYNKLVKKQQTGAASYELMKRKDDLYLYGIVVEYNTDPVVKGYGSAIFFHLWRGASLPTTGCIAMSEIHILKLLEWLDPSKEPVAVMGTEKMLRALAGPS